jgi:hypothetical protein
MQLGGQRFWRPVSLVIIVRTPYPLFVVHVYPERSSRALALHNSYLFSVVQALIVILQYWHAFGLASVAFGGRVDDVAGEDFLPEGKAP